MKKIFNISDNDFNIIQQIIKKELLSFYEIKKDDFICYKDNDKIIAFWRIFNIWENNYELSSVWVDSIYRWKKLWINLINDLLDNKFNKINNLYLSCKIEMKPYYEKVGFKIIDENIPAKFKETLRWARENNIEPIVMKYNN